MSALFRHVVYPAWHWARRDGVNPASRELQANQWKPESDLEQLQYVKLTRLLKFARTYVPYYARSLGETDIDVRATVGRAELERIPCLTKSIIRHEGKNMVSTQLAGNKLISNSTSGSTGEAIRFYTDSRSIPYRKAAGQRSTMWTGWRLGDRAVKLWGAQIDEKFATGLRGRLHGLVSGNRFLSSFDLSEARMDEYIQQIRGFKPVLFTAYPGPLEIFAKHCEDRGVRFPSLRAIISSAETLWPHQRQTIESAFDVPVFDRYGSREVGQIASECEVRKGLHVSADRLLLEIVDDDGRPCRAGEAGRILVTDLDNFGMPLIRYDIGDRAVPAENTACSCGRGLPLIEKVEGRVLEVVRTQDGRSIGGTFWTLLLRSRPGFRQFQVVQTRLAGVTINFVKDLELEQSTLDYFTRRIKDYCGPSFQVEFKQVESIDVTGSGKRRLIISHLDHDHGTA